MADRFWVGGSGNWDASDTTHWSATTGGVSGASVPTSADTATFDTLSNATAYTVTITATANCSNLTMGAPLAGDLTFAGSSALNVYGNFALYAGLIRTYTGALTFKATATGKTITFAGVTMASATVFDGVGGGWTLQDAWNNGTSTITLTNGALVTNNQTVTSGTFDCSNANVRTLTLGTTTWNVNGNWTATTVTNLTFSGASSTINASGAGRVISFGGLTYGTAVLTCSGTSSLFGANTFTTLTITGSAVRTDEWSMAASQTVTGTLTLNGNSAINRVQVRTGTVGTAVTLSGGTIVSNFVDYMDITAGGAGSWNLSAQSVGNCGGNTGITFPTVTNRFWIGGTGNWSDTAEWSATTGGAGSAGVPLCHDTAIFDASSFSAGSQTVTQDMPRIGSVNFTGATNTPTWTTSTAASVFGSITLIAAMVLTASTQAYVFRGRGANTLTSAGNQWNKNISFLGFGGSMTFQDAFTFSNVVRTFTLTNGTLSAGTFAVSIGSFSSNNSNVRTLTMGTGLWTLGDSGVVWGMSTNTNCTFTATTATIKLTDASATAKTINFGGTLPTLGSFWITGAGTGDYIINDGVTLVGDFKVDTPPHELTFQAGKTFTAATWTMMGTAGNVINISSITAATHTLVKTGGGLVSCDYMSISYSIASPTLTFYAGAHSTNGGNNTAWIFTAPPGANSLMLRGVGV